MRILSLVFAALLLSSITATAQVREVATPELRPMVGAFIPTGTQRDVIKDAVLTGLQLGVELPSNVHLLGTFAWSPSKNRLVTAKDRVDLFQYDVGAELFSTTELGSNRMLRPFLGAGVGARSYRLEASRTTKTYAAGYGSLGTELQMGRYAIRIEGRDYITRFKGLTGGDPASTRNDLSVVSGLAIHFF